MAALVDTSVLYAQADADNALHPAVRDYLEGTPEVLVVPATVVPEADYLLEQRLGLRAQLALLRALCAGEYRLEQVLTADLARSAEIMTQYADSHMGVVDASLVAVAERLKITRILTLDHHHFRMFRPRHCAAFELLP